MTHALTMDCGFHHSSHVSLSTWWTSSATFLSHPLESFEKDFTSSLEQSSWHATRVRGQHRHRDCVTIQRAARERLHVQLPSADHAAQASAQEAAESVDRVPSSSSVLSSGGGLALSSACCRSMSPRAPLRWPRSRGPLPRHSIVMSTWQSHGAGVGPSRWIEQPPRAQDTAPQSGESCPAAPAPLEACSASSTASMRPSTSSKNCSSLAQASLSSANSTGSSPGFARKPLLSRTESLAILSESTLWKSTPAWRASCWARSPAGVFACTASLRGACASCQLPAVTSNQMGLSQVPPGWSALMHLSCWRGPA
mmetsp:Transcript_107161/g.279824  ORF Transcript_107161/g.279824 Transcript_107161/m.279824 type:complete len:311 (+) Transcript_107161:1193-2125(+)